MLNQLAEQWTSNPALQLLVEQQFGILCAVLLVGARLTGVFLIGPFFGQKVVPTHVRLLMILLMTVVFTPVALPAFSGSAVASVFPTEWSNVASKLTVTQFASNSLIELLASSVGELAIGSMLGTVVMLIVAALRATAQILDRQTGYAAGGVLNPGFDSEGGGPTTQLIAATSLVVLFVTDMHLEVLRHLLETFRVLPVGQLTLSGIDPALMSDLIQMSFVLAIRITIPMLALMTVVSLGLGVLQRSTPQLNLFSVGLPARMIVHLMFVAWLLPGLASGMAGAIPEMLDRVTQSLIEG